MRLTRWLYLRLLGVTAVVAVGSFWAQLPGLVGSHGIAPAAESMAALHRAPGVGFFDAPTLLWLSSADWMLHALAAVGVLSGVLLIVNLAPRAALIALWASWLSLVTGCRPFTAFQWDVMLLEVAFFSIFFAPPGLRPRLADEREPSPLARFLLAWIACKVTLESGLVKLLSGDEAWRDLTALGYHWWTQPLPTWTAWLMTRLPMGAQRALCAGVFVLELPVPLLALGPRRARLVAAAGLMTMQTALALTGNYAFYGLLTFVAAVPLLDDRALRALLPRRARLPELSAGDAAAPSPREAPAPRGARADGGGSSSPRDARPEIGGGAAPSPDTRRQDGDGGSSPSPDARPPVAEAARSPSPDTLRQVGDGGSSPSSPDARPPVAEAARLASRPEAAAGAGSPSSPDARPPVAEAAPSPLRPEAAPGAGSPSSPDARPPVAEAARSPSRPEAAAGAGSASSQDARPREPRRFGRAGVAVAAVVVALGAAGFFRRSIGDAPIAAVLRALQPFETVNAYGAFAWMSRDRPELTLEGSADGVTWKPYVFPWKPGPLDRRPGFVAPWQPRLDWQMWFAALGTCGDNPWLLSLQRHLLLGTPEVLALFEANPFPAAPPKLVRSITSQYRFSAAKGEWWVRAADAEYCPVVTLGPQGELRRARLGP